MVAPFAGARIEIALCKTAVCVMESLPSRERGLKSQMRTVLLVPQHVAPFAGARIEMKFPDRRITSLYVAPFAGARIEIKLIGGNKNEFGVAPFAGARIEIYQKGTLCLNQ